MFYDKLKGITSLVIGAFLATRTETEARKTKRDASRKINKSLFPSLHSRQNPRLSTHHCSTKLLPLNNLKLATMHVSFTAIWLAFLDATIVKATVQYSLVPQPDKPFAISTKAPNQVDDLTLYLEIPPGGTGTLCLRST